MPLAMPAAVSLRRSPRRSRQPLVRCVDAESVGVPHVLGARVWVVMRPRRYAMRGLLRMVAKCQLSSARQRLLRV